MEETATKERAIGFKDRLIRAIQAGEKSQTRRVMTPQPNWIRPMVGDDGVAHGYCGSGPEEGIRCPYGSPGDRLWVKEALYRTGNGWTKYAADDKPVTVNGGDVRWKWKPAKLAAMYCPRWASRLTLEITDVRVERIQDITEGAIDAEGLTEDVIQQVIGKRAAGFKVKPEHWVRGGDEGLSYCRECCEKEVERLLKEDPEADACVDGGWGSEGDNQAFCETCATPLDNTFTTYACEEEVSHFTEHGFDVTSASDCYSMERILGSCGFIHEPLTPKIKRLGFNATWDTINGNRPGCAWRDNPWVWCLTFKVL